MDGLGVSRRTRGATPVQQSAKSLVQRVDLLPRKQPVQQRAKQRIERILDTTAELLDEIGFDSITTNLVAEQAGVDVASVYQYFPNKYAILYALRTRVAERDRALIESYDRELSSELDWVTFVDGLARYVFEHASVEPGATGIRRATQALPELRVVKNQSDEIAAAILATILKRRGFPVRGERLEAITRLLVETALAIFGLIRTGDPANPEALLEELTIMEKSYLLQCAKEEAEFYPENGESPPHTTPVDDSEVERR